MKENEFLYKDETYALRGVLFSAHNELGRFAKEKQYCDKIEEKLKEKKIPYKREQRISDIQDIPDFIVWDLIVLEVKAKPFLQNDEFEQVQRYLHQTRLKLAILVNFRSKILNPRRILNINNLQVSVKSDSSVNLNQKL